MEVLLRRNRMKPGQEGREGGSKVYPHTHRKSENEESPKHRLSSKAWTAVLQCCNQITPDVFGKKKF